MKTFTQMTVALPYTRLRPEVCQPLAEAGYDVSFYDVSGSDDAYWALLQRLWSRGQTFSIVEHDIIVRPDSLDELAGCPSPWCSFEVPFVGSWGDTYAGLGCAKFSASLIARAPEALARVAEIPGDDVHPAKHWCRVDAWLAAVLQVAGETKCVHGPPLEHLRDHGAATPAHGCC